MPSVFIFRRDLRTADNRGLRACYEAARLVVPIFILNPAQVDESKNAYYSERSFGFMMQSLVDLKASLPELRIYRGDDLEVLAAILAAMPEVTGVHFNADTTPFARERDGRLARWCREKGLDCTPCTADYSLVDPTTMEKPYQRFTPFFNKYIAGVSAELVGVPPSRTSYRVCKLKGHENAARGSARQPLFPGGRAAALAILRRISAGEFERYSVTRDEVADESGTTRLSPYLKFGCVSVREAFAAVEQRHGRAHGLCRELMWRAFYDQVAFHFPRVLRGQVDKKHLNASLSEKYDRIPWNGSNGSSSIAFDAWCAGRTGFPLVDAGMRQLIETGYMHNRVRMLIASFLIKSLHVDWRLGERFFARHLVDYHPSANSGGWQWASGGGADSQQFNRAFSPWLQAKKHDPRCVYIKRHVPELAAVPVEDVLEWETCHDRHSETGYPKPIVDHREAVKASVATYKRALYT